jgi:hypothetical protein
VDTGHHCASTGRCAVAGPCAAADRSVAAGWCAGTGLCADTASRADTAHCAGTGRCAAAGRCVALDRGADLGPSAETGSAAVAGPGMVPPGRCCRSLARHPAASGRLNPAQRLSAPLLGRRPLVRHLAGRPLAGSAWGRTSPDTRGRDFPRDHTLPGSGIYGRRRPGRVPGLRLAADRASGTADPSAAEPGARSARTGALTEVSERRSASTAGRSPRRGVHCWPARRRPSCRSRPVPRCLGCTGRLARTRCSARTIAGEAGRDGTSMNAEAPHRGGVAVGRSPRLPRSPALPRGPRIRC